MMTGGLGLFLDPGGRPLGRRTTSMVAPSFVWNNSEGGGGGKESSVAFLLEEWLSASSEVGGHSGAVAGWRRCGGDG